MVKFQQIKIDPVSKIMQKFRNIQESITKIVIVKSKLRSAISQPFDYPEPNERLSTSKSNFFPFLGCSGTTCPSTNCHRLCQPPEGQCLDNGYCLCKKGLLIFFQLNLLISCFTNFLFVMLVHMYLLQNEVNYLLLLKGRQHIQRLPLEPTKQNLN